MWRCAFHLQPSYQAMQVKLHHICSPSLTPSLKNIWCLGLLKKYPKQIIPDKRSRGGSRGGAPGARAPPDHQK